MVVSIQNTRAIVYYPNPFNPVTTIRHDLSKESFVGIKIYDTFGDVVHNLVNANESLGYKSI